jgi:hypothetical protein
MRCRNPSRRDHDDAVAQAEVGVGPQGPGRMMDHGMKGPHCGTRSRDIEGITDRELERLDGKHISSVG